MIFVLAILHTFLSNRFREISHPARLLHFLGEIEVVFGLWAIPLLLSILYYFDWSTVVGYVSHTVNYTFNIFGVLIWLPLIGQLAQLAISVSPSHSELTGAARMAEEVPRQIANAHTIFNVVNMAIFIWFTGLFARLVERLVPDREKESKEIVTPKYLNENLLDSPSLALEATWSRATSTHSLARSSTRTWSSPIRPGWSSTDSTSASARRSPSSSKSFGWRTSSSTD